MADTGPSLDGPAGPAGPAARRSAAAQVVVDDPAAPALSEADRHHLLRVLRLGPDETVVATDGAGRWRMCRLGRLAGRGSGADAQDALRPLGPVQAEPAPVPRLTVAFCPVKGERPEWVVQKLTELGVDRIVVLAAARSVVRWERGRAGAVLERLSRVAAAAACQARRVWFPTVEGVVALATLVGSGEPVTLAEPGGPPLSPEATVVAVGPEGGWEPGELASAHATAGLGPTVLRAETAALAVAALMAAQRSGRCQGGGAGAATAPGARQIISCR